MNQLQWRDPDDPNSRNQLQWRDPDDPNSRNQLQWRDSDDPNSENQSDRLGSSDNYAETVADGLTLEPVISQVDRLTNANNSSERIVIIDPITGQEIFSGNTRNAKYFLVGNTRNENNIAVRNGLIYKIKDFENSLDFSFKINYQVSCEPGDETKAVEALWDFNGLTPRKKLDQKIKNYFQNYLSDKFDITDLTTNFSSFIKELNRYISYKVEREIGLNIQLQFTLDNDNELLPLTINSSSFLVHFLDCLDRVNIQFESELLIDEENSIVAARFYKHENLADLLEELIKNEIKKYLSGNISAERFYGELNSTVRQEVISHLNLALATYGRKVGFLVLTSEIASSEIEEFLKIDHQVNCQVQEEFIPVKNSILMKLEKSGKYRMAGSPDLEVWVKKNLDIVIQSILFNKKYLDILLNFEPIKAEIENQMGEKAQSIGFAVQQIVSIPELEPLELAKDFSLEVAGTFDTKYDKVKVKLNIVVDAKIEDLTKIENLLNSRTDVKASMKNTIKRTVKAFLHTVDPERFYMRFSQTEKRSDEKSVEKELEEKIKEKLENNPYYATVKYITSKPLETDISERYQKLQGRFCDFKFDVLPYRGIDTVSFNGILQVEKVEKESWNIFQSRDYEIEEIRDYFIRCVKAELKNYPNQVLEFTTPEDKKAFEKLLNIWSYKPIVEQFGLEICVKNADREHTSSEKIAIDNPNEVFTQLEESKKTELQRLLRLVSTLGNRPGNEQEVSKIKDQISDLTSEIKTMSLNYSSQRNKETEELLESSKSSQISFSKILKEQKKEQKRLSANDDIFQSSNIRTISPIEE